MIKKGLALHTHCSREEGEKGSAIRPCVHCLFFKSGVFYCVFMSFALAFIWRRCAGAHASTRPMFRELEGHEGRAGEKEEAAARQRRADKRGAYMSAIIAEAARRGFIRRVMLYHACGTAASSPITPRCT